MNRKAATSWNCLGSSPKRLGTYCCASEAEALKAPLLKAAKVKRLWWRWASRLPY